MKLLKYAPFIAAGLLLFLIPLRMVGNSIPDADQEYLDRTGACVYAAAPDQEPHLFRQVLRMPEGYTAEQPPPPGALDWSAAVAVIPNPRGGKACVLDVHRYEEEFSVVSYPMLTPGGYAVEFPPADAYWRAPSGASVLGKTLSTALAPVALLISMTLMLFLICMGCGMVSGRRGRDRMKIQAIALAGTMAALALYQLTLGHPGEVYDLMDRDRHLVFDSWVGATTLNIADFWVSLALSGVIVGGLLLFLTSRATGVTAAQPVAQPPRRPTRRNPTGTRRI